MLIHRESNVSEKTIRALSIHIIVENHLKRPSKQKSNKLANNLSLQRVQVFSVFRNGNPRGNFSVIFYIFEQILHFL